MSSEDNSENNLGDYVRPLLPALLEFEPITSAIQTYFDELREQRLNTFISQLENREVDLSDEIIERNEFVHSIVVTVEAVLRTERDRKIRYLANLLSSFVQKGEKERFDEYQEYLGILDELSLREIDVLVTLDEYEQEYPQLDDRNKLQRRDQYWGELMDELHARFDIVEKEAEGLLTRLNRTGCYQTITGGFLGYGGGVGELTPVWENLKDWALIQAENEE